MHSCNGVRVLVQVLLNGLLQWCHAEIAQLMGVALHFATFDTCCCFVHRLGLFLIMTCWPSTLSLVLLTYG
jgi:hypothetical protein